MLTLQHSFLQQPASRKPNHLKARFATPAQTSSRHKQYANPHVHHTESDRVFRVSRAITWTRRFSLKHPHKSHQELASPFVQVALRPRLTNLRLASSLAEKTLVSTLPSSSSSQRTQHSPLFLRHKDHTDTPVTPLVSLLRQCGPMLTKWQEQLHR